LALSYSVRMDWVEIFRTTDPLEAERIRDEILGPNGVEAVIRDRTSHPFNTPSMTGGYYLAVEAADADRAREVLESEGAPKAGGAGFPFHPDALHDVASSNGVEHLEPGDDLAEDRVLAIEVRLRRVADEKLRPAGVLAPMGHRE